MAGAPEKGLEILQRLEHSLVKQGKDLAANAHNIIALCYDQLRRSDRAAEHYRRAAELGPTSEVLLSNYGHALMEGGNDASLLATDSDWFATKPGISGLLAGSEERISVEMNNSSLHDCLQSALIVVPVIVLWGLW